MFIIRSNKSEYLKQVISFLNKIPGFKNIDSKEKWTNFFNSQLILNSAYVVSEIKKTIEDIANFGIDSPRVSDTKKSWKTRSIDLEKDFLVTTSGILMRKSDLEYEKTSNETEKEKSKGWKKSDAKSKTEPEKEFEVWVKGPFAIFKGPKIKGYGTGIYDETDNTFSYRAFGMHSNLESAKQVIDVIYNYGNVKNLNGADFIEYFNNLPGEERRKLADEVDLFKQKNVAGQMDKKKEEKLRNTVLSNMNFITIKRGIESKYATMINNVYQYESSGSFLPGEKGKGWYFAYIPLELSKIISVLKGSDSVELDDDIVEKSFVLNKNPFSSQFPLPIFLESLFESKSVKKSFETLEVDAKIKKSVEQFFDQIDRFGEKDPDCNCFELPVVSNSCNGSWKKGYWCSSKTLRNGVNLPNYGEYCGNVGVSKSAQLIIYPSGKGMGSCPTKEKAKEVAEELMKFPEWWELKDEFQFMGEKVRKFAEKIKEVRGRICGY